MFSWANPPKSEGAYLYLVSQERMLNDEFDELMRSGATMKVSLTPDRLKTMEVGSSSSADGMTLLTPALGVQGREKSPWGSQEQTWD